MLRDARELADGTTLQADLCIVGAGAAGLTLAQAFADTPHTVVLLAARGDTADAGARSIYRVEAETAPRLGVDPTRQWYLGGSTNHWAGNCRPLDEADFQPRDWIPRSGWPLRRGGPLAVSH